MSVRYVTQDGVEQEARALARDAELGRPELYVLDLRETDTFAVRSKKCAVLAERVSRDTKLARGDAPALFVVDEAHNYVPERTTGFMAEAARHGSLGALTTIAVEGRKFSVGLVVFSQRPSRIAKGGYTLDVDCADGDLLAEIRAAVEEVLA